MAHDSDDQIPADQQVTREIPADQPPVGASVPDDAPAPEPTTVSAAQGLGAPRRRDRWRQVTRPTSRRGRGLLAALAAVVLVLVGGAAGFAIGHADGGRGDDGGFAVQDGGRGDGGGRGDRDGEGGRGDRGDPSTTSPSTTSPSTTSPSTSSSSSSATPTA